MKKKELIHSIDTEYHYHQDLACSVWSETEILQALSARYEIEDIDEVKVKLHNDGWNFYNFVELVIKDFENNFNPEFGLNWNTLNNSITKIYGKI